MALSQPRVEWMRATASIRATLGRESVESQNPNGVALVRRPREMKTMSIVLPAHILGPPLRGFAHSLDGYPGLHDVRCTHVAPPWADIGPPLRGSSAHRSFTRHHYQSPRQTNIRLIGAATRARRMNGSRNQLASNAVTASFKTLGFSLQGAG